MKRTLSPIQGIILLILLLCIPVGIFFFTTRSVGEIRSKAGERIEPVYNKPKSKTTTIPLGGCDDLECVPGTNKYYQFESSKGSEHEDCLCLSEAQREENESGKSPKHGPLYDGDGPNSTKNSGGTGGAGGNGALPTPLPLSQRCNAPCTSDSACGEGMVCAQVEGVMKCRSAQCYGVEDCMCYKVTAPTPEPSCNSSCTTDAQCGTAMVCVQTAVGNKCRNPQCYGKETCICYSTTDSAGSQGTGGSPQSYTPPSTPYTNYSNYVPPAQPTPTPTISSMLLAELLSLSPTPTPFLMTTAPIAQPILTIDPFYDAKKRTNPLITLTGTAEPNATLTLTIVPDGASGTAVADALGNWQFLVPTKMTNGEKQLTVLSVSVRGGRTTKTEVFTVVGGFQFPWPAIVFTILLLSGIGGYVLYYKMKEKKKINPPSQYPPTPETPVIDRTPDTTTTSFGRRPV